MAAEAGELTLRAWRVSRGPDGAVAGGAASLGWDPQAASADAVVAVEAAGFNYKDALACVGHAGVMRVSPLVPGIDAAIGMAGGAELVTTVHPFILRGVTLAGIDAATQLTQADRGRLWAMLADFWPRIRDVFPVTTLGLGDVGSWADRMLAGDTLGRGVVVP